jgi:Zn-finger nucleic acid-binding protein
MFRGTRFCSKCGAEAVRELIENDKPLPCPRCRNTLQGMQLGKVRISECEECGGLWIDPDALQALCNDRESHAQVVETLVEHAARRPLPPGNVRYLPCPDCTRLMNRTNFAKVSGVIIDVCRQHGVWLDRGELEHIITFVNSGGLAKQRKRELELLAEETRRLHAVQSQGGPRSHSDYSIYLGVNGVQSREERADGLFSALAGLFTT